MPYRKIPFVNGEIYHIFNRGVAKMPIFENKRDYRRLLETIYYYQFQGPKPQFSQIQRFPDIKFEMNQKIVEILCYCLMPNHYHLLIRQLHDNGISEFINKVSNSYTKYFNTAHERVGPLVQGQFKAVRIEDDTQFIHVTRYIHLNPSTSFLVNNLNDYLWSSYPTYIGLKPDKIPTTSLINSFFKTTDKYEQFVLDQKDYAQKLKLIEHVVFD